MPERYIKREGDAGIARYDYEATELSVNVDDELTIHNLESGWIWCTNHGNQNGWVPLKHVEIVSTLDYLLEEAAVAPFDFEATSKAHGWAALHARLAAVDPEAARRIHPNDPQRIQDLKKQTQKAFGQHLTKKLQILSTIV